jgi:ADP-heptose:LPS heptosyltransferase
LTRKAFSPLFEGLGFNVSIKSFDPKRHAGIFGFLKLLNSILRGGYSHVADMHDVLRSRIIRTCMRMMFKKVASIDKDRSERNAFIAKKSMDVPLRHITLRYMDVFEKLGFFAELSYTNYFEFKERSFYPLRTVTKEKTGNWIGIAPFSKHVGKIYPIEKMEKVVSALAANPDNHLFLFSSNGKEEKTIEQWTQKYPGTVSVSGKLNLENEMILISYLDVMISMDSANMHLASLVEVPVVSIWGATHPSLGFYGYNQDPVNAVQVSLECRPCSVYGQIPCAYGHYNCLKRIKESAILKKVQKILAAKPVEEAALSGDESREQDGGQKLAEVQEV